MMLWDLKDARRFGMTPSHKGPVWSLAFSQGDGAILASGMLLLTLVHWTAYLGCYGLLMWEVWPTHDRSMLAWQMCTTTLPGCCIVKHTVWFHLLGGVHVH